MNLSNKKFKKNRLAIDEGSFVNDGFTIIRKAIPTNLQIKIQKSAIQTLETLSPDFRSNKNITQNRHEVFSELILSLMKKSKPYEILTSIFDNFLREGIIDSIYTEKKVFDFITDILGKDLSYCTDPGLTLNLPGISNPHRNYLFKGFHQEVWSGADIHSMQIWAPLFQSDSSGGMVLVRSSHLWGHIPHRNRDPIDLPNNLDEIQTDLEIGDVIIFHPLLLHRSAPLDGAKLPRLAFPCLFKNFRMPNNSFEIYRNWRIFSYSALSHIDRRLGNHHLSPYRLIDINNQQFNDGTLKLK